MKLCIMVIKEKLQTDLTQAIRSRDEVKSGTIRMLLAAITNEEVAGKAAKVLSDIEIVTVSNNMFIKTKI